MRTRTDASLTAATSPVPDSAPLELREVTKRFPGVTAVDRVSMKVARREVVGLVGQNGSGKSTLLKILAGIHQPDEGEIRIHGRRVVFRNPHEARTRGIGIVFQEQSLLPNLTVAENIVLGAEDLQERTWGRYRWSKVRLLAQGQLDKLGLTLSPSAPVSTLTQVERQSVELAKALTAELYAPSEALLLLDEATSTLPQRGIEVLFSEIWRVRERSSVIFVSHRLDEVLEVSDRVYVLRDGVCVAERVRGTYDEDELFELMISRESVRDYFALGRQRPHAEDVRLSVQDLTKAGDYESVSFDLHVGEILGLCGVEGSGRDKLMRTIFGIERAESGRILLDGKVLRARPEEAVRRGVGYIPAERTAEAALMELDVGQNITISHLDQFKRGPVLSHRTEHRVATQWVERLKISTRSLRTSMASLSGGNQQKVVFARWLLSPEIRLLLLDHPTRGLDVGAKAEVYDIIRDAARAGAAILLMSDSLEETIALSHRVLVMKDGAMTASYAAPADAKPSQLEIVEKML